MYEYVPAMQVQVEIFVAIYVCVLKILRENDRCWYPLVTAVSHTANKSLYDVMAFETDSYMLSVTECCGLVSFKKLNLKPCLSDSIQCIVLDFFCSN